ncbi:MAG: hypothetical protein NTX55_00080 [Candidatus Parcubacteria bacterium]|nr:hypothetical protein [Candidatus Parcubacteria bacterium]
MKKWLVFVFILTVFFLLSANYSQAAWNFGYFNPFYWLKPAPSSIQLPSVSNNEIIIDSKGVKTISDYINYFLTNSSKISFDGRKFKSVLKDGNGIFLFTPQLVEKAVKNGLTQEIKNSLLVHKEFIEAKLIFLKSIKVSGEAVNLHKKMIGFDKLTLELIQKTLDLENNKISKTELNDFYQKYVSRANLERKDFVKKIGLATDNSDPLKRIIVWLGLKDDFFAFAQSMPPFGGTIFEPIYCVCNVGFLVPVGLPTPPVSGSLFVPLVFIGSPLFFEYKSLRPGAWWLGLYSPTIIPCLQPCPAGCCPVGFSNLIYMAGTSP